MPRAGSAIVAALFAAQLIAPRAARASSTGPRLCGMYPAAGAPLAMLESRVEISVRGPIVETIVTQRFQNTSDRATEATYVFPLPYDAAVSALDLRVGTRTIRASIERRADAQRRYEAAVAAGVGAALLDEERPDVFTQTVSAIPAHGTVEVTLRYDSVARLRGDTWELALPMVVAPRFVPGAASGRPTTGTGRAPDTDRAPDASRVTPGSAPGAGGSTSVALHFTDEPRDVDSPTHELRGAAREYAFVDPHSDHDAIVRWRATSPSAGWTETDASGGGFAAVVLAAPPAPAKREPARFVLALDRAATIRGDADVVEHPLVRALLGDPRGADRVSVIGSDALAWALSADISRALDRAWPTPAGAFDLTRTLRDAKPSGAPIVLVSDGLVADDAAAIAAAKQLGVPIHAIGVGPAPARGLLVQLAAVTGGTVRFAIPGDDLARLAADVLADATAPPAPIAVSWGTLAAFDVVPGTLPRLGAGQAMLVLARVKKAQAANGRARGDVFAIETLAPARGIEGATTAHGPLARRWARIRLDELLAAGDRPAATAHALAYGLVSPFTSLVAIGTDVVVEGGVKHSVAVPVSVPAGMEWERVKTETAVDTTIAEKGNDNEDGDALREPKKKAHEDDEDAPHHTKAGRPTKRPRPDRKEAEERPTMHAPQRQPAPAPEAPAAGKPADEAVDVRRSPPAIDVGRSLSGAVSDEDDYEAVTITASGLYTHRGPRISAALGGGLAFDHGTTGLLSLSARLETGGLTLVGGEGQLWLVDGTHPQGRLMATIARRGIFRRLELGAGLGAHLGSDSGLAASARLRIATPLAHFGLYLRYDAAYLLADPSRAEQAVSAGVDLSF